MAHGVGELGVDDFAVLKVDGEGAGGSWVGFVDLGGIVRAKNVCGIEKHCRVTPRPMMPIITIVTRSNQVTFSH